LLIHCRLSIGDRQIGLVNPAIANQQLISSLISAI